MLEKDFSANASLLLVVPVDKATLRQLSQTGHHSSLALVEDTLQGLRRLLIPLGEIKTLWGFICKLFINMEFQSIFFYPQMTSI